MFGLAEALAHLERALRLWDVRAGRGVLVGLDLGALCTWAADLPSHTGAAPRAVDLARRAIDLVGASDPLRAALLHETWALSRRERPTDAALAAPDARSSSYPRPALAGARPGIGGARGTD